MIHTKDSDCTVDPATLCCTTCGVDHSGQCSQCGGKGYHKETCPMLCDSQHKKLWDIEDVCEIVGYWQVPDEEKDA